MNAFYAFEVLTDPAVKEEVSLIKQNMSFMEEIGNLLREYNLNSLLSIAILKRSSLEIMEGQIYLNTNFNMITYSQIK